jgi:copper resistance protein B
MTRVPILVLLLVLAPAAPAQHLHEPLFGYTQGERLEYRDEDRALFWDLQGLYGGDYQRFVWKTEGAYTDGDSEGAELQLLYGRAWTAFFDLQFGLRYADTDAGGLAYAVAGMQGLLPYRVEGDLALFLSEDGDVTGRAEFEKDFLLSERWVLQPRAEIKIAFSDVPELALDAGVTELSLGLRLRYEYTRKLAPYLGVAWLRNYGGAGDDSGEGTALAGIRFWF